MLTYTITHNIYPNQSFSVHISSQTKLIILQNPSDTNFLQNPSDTNFIILQNPSMFREIEKNNETQTKSKQSTWTKTLKYKHWNFEEHKTEQGGFTEGERKRSHLGRGWILKLESAPVSNVSGCACFWLRLLLLHLALCWVKSGLWKNGTNERSEQ